ncbi:signal transduction histidine kinase [Paraburkholderia caballeronis]|uniref:sensor histidine kinase n=1 Tax=Paraburkholderia caballeronis TaxID=416943 RepID=UPI0010660A45|nr:HAMP domain-containing sensor histidine kinase [Paraburkholderia caballeronis]TDV27235.1 signal transduction histidine kinase [Paraburkholderia caballeronis]
MLKHWTQGLSARLWTTTVVALAISLTVLFALVVYVLGHYPEQTLGRREQTQNIDSVVSGIVFDDAGLPVSVKLSERDAWLFNVAPTELKYRVLDEQGRVLLDSTGAKKNGPWLADGLAASVGRIAHVDIDGQQFSVATRRISRGQSVFYAQTATSSRFVEALVSLKIKPIPAIVRIIFLLAAIIFAVVLQFSIRRILKPLRDASDAAALITPRHLKTRLSTVGVPREIKPLINAFNEALGRLENGFTVQQQFLAAAAHELQTPLTLIRGQIELQPEIGQKDLLFREIDLMSRQVRQLLHLAEVSEAQNFNFGEVSGVDVAQDVVAYLARKADAKQVKLHVHERGAPSSIWADKSALFILLKNIVENAINVSPADGVVSLAIDAASIEICDEGPGIHNDHLPFLFKRFWRAPGARHDGAGLGLAICKEIALTHDWQLTVNSQAIGTRFTVWL